MDAHLGTTIAVRELTWKRVETGDRTVIVVLGAPRQFDDSDDFYAPYQIQGIGSERIQYAAGVDGFQALLLVVKMIRVDLEIHQSDRGDTLVWLGDDSGGCGF